MSINYEKLSISNFQLQNMFYLSARNWPNGNIVDEPSTYNV